VSPMNDLLYLGLTFAFFAVAFLVLKAVSRL
jgi:hypothetical protein